MEREFVEMLQRFKPVNKVALTMSPESGDDHVRYAHGRKYSNDSIIKTAKSCVEQDLPITLFFMGALAQETTETVDRMFKLWETLLSLKGWVNVEYGPMILLDPGSIAYDHPVKEGYVIKNKTMSSLYEASLKSTWVDWINYETENFNLQEIKDTILSSIEQLIRIKLKYKRMGEKRAEAELKNLIFNKFVLEEIKHLNQIGKRGEKENRLKELKEIERDPLLLESYIMTHD